MKNTLKTVVILDLICAVLWTVVSVMDIVNDGFTKTFIFHAATALLFYVGSIAYFKSSKKK